MGWECTLFTVFYIELEERYYKWATPVFLESTDDYSTVQLPIYNYEFLPVFTGTRQKLELGKTAQISYGISLQVRAKGEFRTIKNMPIYNYTL